MWQLHLHPLPRPQVAEAETGGEASGAAGGPRALPQVGAGGAACAAHEGPAVHRQRHQAIQVHRAAGLPLLNHTNPAGPLNSHHITSHGAHQNTRLDSILMLRISAYSNLTTEWTTQDLRHSLLCSVVAVAIISISVLC